MNILHTVEFYSPSIGGMQEVVRQLSERMVGHGHHVTVATTAIKERRSDYLNGVRIVDFNISGNLVKGITGDPDAYIKFLKESDFDIVTNFAAQQWTSDIAFPLLDEIKGKKIFVPTGFSGLYDPEYKQYFEDMKQWMKKYQANVFLSDNYRDINFARENNIKNNVLIPNGAAADEFVRNYNNQLRKKFGITDSSFLVLHVGSYTGLKGHKEAVEIFLKADIPDSYLLMIGNKNDFFLKNIYRILNPKFLVQYFLKRKHIIITSLSRNETVDAYLSSDLFLFPSNIECSPIVLFESMAASTPFLSTDTGNSKEIIEWSSGGELLPTNFDSSGKSNADIAGSAKTLREIYLNKEKRMQMKEAGKSSWKKNFSWEIITEKYLDLYRKLINNSL